MNTPIDHLTPPARSGFAKAWRRLRGRDSDGEAVSLSTIPCLPISAGCFETLENPTAFRETLLALIASARRRILICALYLQDDDGGREILAALYAARKAQPQLEIAVFVDWHRAQRGLIGKAKVPGNAALYRAMAEQFGPGVTIHGVPVQSRELMGVLHLKGFVIDDAVLYSGASLNDVYLNRHGRYRIDRYHLIRNEALADCFARLLTDVVRPSPAVNRLDTSGVPKTAELRPAIARLRRQLATGGYAFAPATIGTGEIGITPLLGLGVRDNELNQALLALIRHARRRIVLFTPYFNLPGPLRRLIDKKIKSGCHVSIILGDKTANDFFIPPDEPFKAIGALPYLYEGNLRRFCKSHQRAIAAGTLDVFLWRHDNNTFHLKGMLVDNDYALITGHNTNPRAWRLDLENGMLIHDPQKLLAAQHQAELERILQHATRLADHRQIPAVESYPPVVQRLLRRLARIRIDRLVNHVM